jgi:hypothetical protein
LRVALPPCLRSLWLTILPLSYLLFQVLYSKKVGYTPDYPTLLQHITRLNPEQGAEFASSLVNDESGPLVDVERVRPDDSGRLVPSYPPPPFSLTGALVCLPV